MQWTCRSYLFIVSFRETTNFILLVLWLMNEMVCPVMAAAATVGFNAVVGVYSLCDQLPAD